MELNLKKKPMGFQVVELTDDSETILYANSLEARLSMAEFHVPTGFGEGSMQLIHKRTGKPTEFAHFPYTGRELEYLRGTNDENRKYYPDRWLNPANLRGKKVLDLDCGNGSFVRDLIDAGIDAYGLDLYIPPVFRNDSHLVQAIFEESHLQSEQFDVIYSTYGNFYFNTDKDKLLLRLQEASRILRPQGVLLISPAKLIELGSALESIDGLKMLPTDPDWNSSGGVTDPYYAEIVKASD